MVCLCLQVNENEDGLFTTSTRQDETSQKSASTTHDDSTTTETDQTVNICTLCDIIVILIHEY